MIEKKNGDGGNDSKDFFYNCKCVDDGSGY